MSVMPKSAATTILLMVNMFFCLTSVMEGVRNNCIVISKEKPASQSSTYSDKTLATNGNDGEKSQYYDKTALEARCAHTNRDKNAWWKVDLRSTYRITKVKVYNRADCCAERLESLQIQTSTDDTSWKECANMFEPAVNGGVYTLLCMTEARYVRLQLMKDDPEELAICEAEVISCDENPLVEMETINIPIKGQLFWNTIFSYDTTGSNAKVEHILRNKNVDKNSQKLMKKVLNEDKRNNKNKHEASASVEASYMAVKGTASYKGEFSNEIATLVSGTDETESKHETEKEVEETIKLNIDPNSKLSMYQPCFQAEGVTHCGGKVTTSQKKPDNKDVEFTVDVKPIQFVGGIDVVYADAPASEPEARIREFDKPSDVSASDINRDFAGKYVYLVPIYTYDGSVALTGVDIIVQGSYNPAEQDLAREAGGDYRYLNPIRDRREHRKIDEIFLWRPGHYSDKPPNGFDGISSDINAGREGDYLYLIWKTKTTE